MATPQPWVKIGAGHLINLDVFDAIVIIAQSATQFDVVGVRGRWQDNPVGDHVHLCRSFPTLVAAEAFVAVLAATLGTVTV